MKSDKTPYKVFTPFYKSLNYIWESEALEEYEVAKNLYKGNNQEIPFIFLSKAGRTFRNIKHNTERSSSELVTGHFVCIAQT